MALLSPTWTSGRMEPVIFISEGLELSGTLREAGHPGAGAVMFCHGAFEHQNHWAAYAERMAGENLTTVTFDFAGHGTSQGIRSSVDLRLWAYNIRDAFCYLESKGYRRFALVGWGHGGSAALLAAAHDPRLACVATLAAPVTLVPPIGERIAYGLAVAAARLGKAIWKKPLTFSRIGELNEMRVLSDDEANHAYLSDPRLRAAFQAVPIPESLDSVWFDITPVLAKIKIPVLVIHGTQDKVVALQQSQKLFEKLQGPKQLEWIDGCGHALHLDREKDKVYSLIAQWVRCYLKTEEVALGRHES